MAAGIVERRISVENQIAVLLPRIAGLLEVPLRPIRLVVRPTTACLAFTRQAWHPETPTMVVDPECCDESILAHEIAHCLVPSNWLLAAEGVAIWTSCRFGGGSTDLLFQEQTPNEIVRRHWLQKPSPETLAEERVGMVGLLSGASFHQFESRLAHAVAASFLGMILETVPDLAVVLSNVQNRDRPLKAVLADTAGSSFQELEARWRASVIGPDKALSVCS